MSEDGYAMEMVIGDPFALPEESKVAHRQEIITGGRYRLPNRDGSHKKGGWQRVTNLVGAYSDSFGLRLWEIEQVLRAVGGKAGAELLAELAAKLPEFDEMVKSDRKAWVEAFTEKCKKATKADEGSRHGTHRHGIVEEHHEGLPPAAHWTPGGRQQVALYASALVRHKLRAVEGMQERRVLVEELEAVGTLDNVLECLVSGVFRISDLKTQKRFWTWLEVSAQLACYAHSVAIWEPDGTGGGKWVDWPLKLELDVAHVAWMPRCGPDGEPLEEPRVDIYDIDIKAGWETAKRAREVVKDRAAAKRVRNPRGWLRPAPEPTEHERWAARFAAVETVAEGSALVAEAIKAGAWDAVLADCATDAAARVSAEQGLTVTKK